MPDWSREIRARLERLSLRPEREAELTEEMAQHLDDLYDELRAAGMAETDAMRTALEELGEDLIAQLRPLEPRVDLDPPVLGAMQARRNVLGHAWRDVRHAVRALRRRPGFALVAMLTLALGIGGTTAIFGVVRGVLIRPLPHEEPDRLVSYWLTAPERGLDHIALTDALFAFHRDRSRTIASMAAYWRSGTTLTGVGDPEYLPAARVTWGFFETLGNRPLLGRTFRQDDEGPGSPAVAILSHRFWQRRFAGDSSIVGRSITLGGEPAVVVGVMPGDFERPSWAEVWLPLGLDLQRFSPWYLSAIGRLAPGATPDDAARELGLLTDEFKRINAERFPDEPAEGSRPAVVIAQPLAQTIVGDVRTPLLVLLTAAGVILLIACANVANLLLARTAARRHEMALRRCLGAGTGRIAAQTIAESLLLALGGAALGVVLAIWGTAVLARLASEQIPRMDEVGVDVPVMLAALGLALICGLLLGVAPAVRGTRFALSEALRQGSRTSASGASRRTSNGFVIAQCALSLVLLSAAGLLLRSFQRVLDVDPGVNADGVLVGRVQLPDVPYETEEHVRGFYAQLLDRVRAMPGVEAAGIAQTTPFRGRNLQDEYEVQGFEPSPGEPVPVANLRMISPGWFAAVGTAFAQGRDFTDADDADAPPVAIIDEEMARRYWPDADPIGRVIRQGTTARGNPPRTIVGVVRTVKHEALEEAPVPALYLPHAQLTTWSVDVAVRTSGDPAGYATQLRRVIAELDRGLAPFDVATLEASMARTLVTRRLVQLLIAAFALVALTLAAIGLYGVLSIGVTERMREFGIRVALGAKAGDVKRLVLREGMGLVLVGVALGVLGGLWVTRFMRGLLYGVASTDPVTFVSVSLLLVLVAALACWLPARRATMADPMTVMREE